MVGFFGLFRTSKQAINIFEHISTEADLTEQCKYINAERMRSGPYYEKLVSVDKLANKPTNGRDYISFTMWARSTYGLMIVLSSVERPPQKDDEGLLYQFGLSLLDLYPTCIFCLSLSRSLTPPLFNLHLLSF